MIKKNLLTGLALLLVLAIAGIYQVYSLSVAHSTFDNYYKFRGCVELVEKTDTYGTCKLASGETIKLVLVNGKWYLDGDTPHHGFNFL